MNKQNECNCISKDNVIHFQKQLVPIRPVELEPTAGAKKFLMVEPEPEI